MPLKINKERYRDNPEANQLYYEKFESDDRGLAQAQPSLNWWLKI